MQTVVDTDIDTLALRIQGHMEAGASLRAAIRLEGYEGHRAFNCIYSRLRRAGWRYQAQTIATLTKEEAPAG